ncbi:hypothetical protein V5799_022525 [Amblyomma americanum]|uniref:Uncharacterized protein n=1 Tax=Amblyomma americanum TaxID=6943 RepID=A0AAQ4FMA1_AMBAM
MAICREVHLVRKCAAFMSTALLLSGTLLDICIEIWNVIGHLFLVSNDCVLLNVRKIKEQFKIISLVLCVHA